MKSNNTLNLLLKDYEQKKYFAEQKQQKAKTEFFISHPELEDINSKLSTLALDISKAVLNKNIDIQNKLKTEFDKLKIEKDELLKSLDIPARCIRTSI